MKGKPRHNLLLFIAFFGKLYFLLTNKSESNDFKSDKTHRPFLFKFTLYLIFFLFWGGSSLFTPWK